MINRRTAIALTAATVMPALAGPARAQTTGWKQTGPHPLNAAWEAWKAAYMAPDGRVVDTLQQGASHSESQGYGLFLAATMGDAAAFRQIDTWTQTHLALRPDSLLAWRFLPDMAQQVPDMNNASDGDLFYAWALIRAAETLRQPDLMGRAARIAQDLERACVVAHPDASGRLLFMPAAGGFARDGSYIVNFSYHMPMALRDLSRATGVTSLAVCANDGEAMVASLAEVGLVPDWISIGPDGMRPAVDLSANNGYEAMRVPLFLIWSGRFRHPAVARQAAAYAAAAQTGAGTPTVMERVGGAAIERSPDPGYAALAGLSDCVDRQLLGSSIPLFTTNQPYYPATLHMFALLAQFETASECVPI